MKIVLDNTILVRAHEQAGSASCAHAALLRASKYDKNEKPQSNANHA
jgi:hypothetical protein